MLALYILCKGRSQKHVSYKCRVQNDTLLAATLATLHLLLRYTGSGRDRCTRRLEWNM